MLTLSHGENGRVASDAVRSKQNDSPSKQLLCLVNILEKCAAVQKHWFALVLLCVETGRAPGGPQPPRQRRGHEHGQGRAPRRASPHGSWRRDPPVSPLVRNLGSSWDNAAQG